MKNNEILIGSLKVAAVVIVFGIIGAFVVERLTTFHNKLTPNYPYTEKSDLFTTIHIEWNIKAVCLNDKSTCTCFKKQNYEWAETTCPRIIEGITNAK